MGQEWGAGGQLLGFPEPKNPHLFQWHTYTRLEAKDGKGAYLRSTLKKNHYIK